MAKILIPSWQAKCNRCKFFSLGPPGAPNSFCHRYPPVSQMFTGLDGEPGLKSFYAITTSAGWCGEFVDRGIPFNQWVSQNQDDYSDGSDARYVINEIICDRSLADLEAVSDIAIAISEKPDTIPLRHIFYHVKRLHDAWRADA